MTTNDMVKAYQKVLMEQVRRHQRASLQLEQAIARRAEIVSTQEQLVAEARATLDGAVATMAQELGPELTARLVDLDLVVVRRLARDKPAGGGHQAGRVP